MKLENLTKSSEAKSIKRVGRGPGSGMGKTSTRGHKGQKARSGSSIPAWFQGGQTPLFKRIPKRGFNNKRFEVRYAIINVSEINELFKDGETVTIEVLKEMGKIKKTFNGLKVLGNGDLNKKLTVKAKIFSESALSKIIEAGGKAEVI